MTSARFSRNFKHMLSSGVALTALLAWGGEVRAQTPSNDQLYKMLLELKADNSAVRADNERMRKEIAELRRKLSPPKGEPASPVAASPAPQTPAPLPIAQSDTAAPSRKPSETNPFGSIPAAYPPAVSAPNFKVEAGAVMQRPQGASGQRTDNLFGGYGAASATFPLNANYGASFDAALGEIGSAPYVGGAAHLFWRNPTVGLLGFYGSLAYANLTAPGGAQLQPVYAKAGLAAEAYIGRASFEAVAGWETGGPLNNANFTFGAAGVRNRYFDQIDLGYYVTDNWRVGLGQRYSQGVNSVSAKTEYQLDAPQLKGVSLFVEASAGDHNFREALAAFDSISAPTRRLSAATARMTRRST